MKIIMCKAIPWTETLQKKTYTKISMDHLVAKQRAQKWMSILKSKEDSDALQLRNLGSCPKIDQFGIPPKRVNRSATYSNLNKSNKTPSMSYSKLWLTRHAFPAKWERQKSVFESFGFSSLGWALKFWNKFIAKVSCVDFPSMLWNKTRKKDRKSVV